MSKLTRLILTVFLMLCCACSYSFADDALMEWSEIDLKESLTMREDLFVLELSDAYVVSFDRSESFFVYEKDGRKYSFDNFKLNYNTGCQVLGNDFVCAGGIDEKGLPSNNVVLIQWDKEKKKLNQTNLPPLPESEEACAVAVLNDKLYVFGKNIWGIDFVNNRIEGMWQKLGVFPRELSGCSSAATIQSNGDNFLIYVFVSGYGQTSAFSFNPVADQPLVKLETIPVELDQISVSALGQSHIILAGLGQSRLYTYHTITDAYSQQISTSENQASIKITSGSLNDFTLFTKMENEEIAILRGVISIQKGNFKLIDYIAIFIYMFGLIGIGFYFSRKKGGIGDFFLGGRRIPGWAAGLSLLATQVSSIGFMAIPSKAYATNWLYLGTIFGWFFAVPIVIRFFIPFFRTIKIATAYDYLERRFSGSVRSFGAVLFSLVMITRMAVVLYLPSLALSAVTGVDKYLCIIIAGVICTIYTTIGGIEAVVWTDVVQVIVMLGSIITCILMVMFGIDGGPAKFFSTAVEYNKFEFINFDWNFATATIWVVLIGSVIAKLAALTSDQSLIQRYSTTKNVQQTSRSLWTDAFVSIPWAILVFLLGTTLFVYYRINPEKLSPAVTNDAIVPWFVAQSLPAGIAGIVIAGIFAAAQSTLSSTLNSVSMTIVTDFYKRFRVNVSDKQMLMMAKVLTVSLGVIGTVSALLMASAGIKSLWDFFIQMTGLFAGGLAALFALGIFTKKANSIGALIGAVSSALVMLYVQKYTSLHVFFYTVIGYGWCYIVGYFISIATGGTKKDLTALTYYMRVRDNEV